MDNYNYHKGMNGIIQELKGLLKTKNIGTDSDRALLLDFQATLETKPEKAIKLEKDALAQIETITVDNARLVSNLHANLGGLYRMNGHPDLAGEHMEKSISLLDQFNLLHINDSIPQIANYAMFLTEQQEPERGLKHIAEAASGGEDRQPHKPQSHIDPLAQGSAARPQQYPRHGGKQELQGDNGDPYRNTNKRACRRQCGQQRGIYQLSCGHGPS